jgi:hypothetical protein
MLKFPPTWVTFKFVTKIPQGLAVFQSRFNTVAALIKAYTEFTNSPSDKTFTT